MQKKKTQQFAKFFLKDIKTKPAKNENTKSNFVTANQKFI